MNTLRALTQGIDPSLLTACSVLAILLLGFLWKLWRDMALPTWLVVTVYVAVGCGIAKAAQML